jgi:hypothetical protein
LSNQNHALARSGRVRLSAFALVLMAVCTMCLALAGCATPSPTDVTKQAVEAVKAQDADALAKVYAGDASNVKNEMLASNSESKELADSADLTDDQQQVVEDFSSKLYDFDYTLSDEAIDGDTATVKVTVNTYNFGSIFSKAVQDTLSAAFMYAFSSDHDAAQKATTQAFIDSLDTQLKGLTDKDKSTTATVSLQKQDGKWVVQPFDNEFYNAVTGGMFDASANLEKAFGSNS